METTFEKKKYKTKDLLLCAIFAALICIGAYITIPLPLVPITMQWFFVAITGMLLGAKRGAVSTLLYMIMGLIGMPVFSGGKGGIGTVFSPNFGYIYGFVISALVIGLIMQKSKKTVLTYSIAGLIGLAITYGLGFIHLYIFMTVFAGKTVVLFDLFKSAVLVFLPKDALCTILCALVAVRIPKNLLD
ncbi:biotin transporter BioY [Criibacterium bergeronii]|uniref:Biotin transporter n=1 Tax=Criibacterium bergeronii TaxID=1871336 RepID=A0A371IP98_9FIRM|nr:biotin transporter BioY [Criibacterium bergeronii]MBS6063470.1 biotin transporter BioY [Peptostreptococcaceae bacterium]RDY22308.1 biotin transporter BioY [Criibacterium bergeronii]TRW25471.1 biotin transporter BioY [Criibacterium bergeronii]